MGYILFKLLAVSDHILHYSSIINLLNGVKLCLQALCWL